MARPSPVCRRLLIIIIVIALCNIACKAIKNLFIRDRIFLGLLILFEAVAHHRILLFLVILAGGPL